MIELYQPPRTWGLPSSSPFCVKLETYFRMANVPYQLGKGTPIGAPKGKIPYVKIDNRLVGDSTLIIQRLKKELGDPLDKHLSPEQKAQAWTMQMFVEDHLYFAAAWLRWHNPESWHYVNEELLKILPPIIGKLIVKKIRAQFFKNIHAQGMGRHSPEEILNFAKNGVEAAATLLGDKLYFMGSEPTTLDATAYGFLVHFLRVPWDSELKRYGNGFPNLVAYCERMKKRYWSDL